MAVELLEPTAQKVDLFTLRGFTSCLSLSIGSDHWKGDIRARESVWTPEPLHRGKAGVRSIAAVG